MKALSFIMKIVAAALAAAAIACVVVAYWDKIVEVCQAITDKVTEKAAALRPAEYDDYAE